MMRFIACISFLAILCSCGKHDFPDYEESNLIEKQEADGFYHADLKQLNSGRASKLKARAVFWVKGNQFYAKVVASNAMPRQLYHQYIHEGSHCPDRDSDTNLDGVVSFSEAIAVSGERLVPLDRDLETQGKGNDWFPETSKSGKFYYSSATAVQLMLRDLRKKDQYPNDGLSKLGRNEDLDLGRRTIILYQLSNEVLLPAACAEIKEDIGPRG